MSAIASDERTQDIEAGTVADAAVEAGPAWRLVGWAMPAEPRTWAHLVLCGADGRPLAHAIANRFSADAFARGVGFGWVGFTLDLARAWPRVRGTTVTGRCMRAGAPIFEYDAPDVAGERSPERKAIASVTELLALERALPPDFAFWHLDLYLAAFLAVRGVEAFVRRSYTYVLERDADPVGLGAYVSNIEEGLPLRAVLQSMFDSDERRAKVRPRLALPGEAAFPFYPD